MKYITCDRCGKTSYYSEGCCGNDSQSEFVCQYCGNVTREGTKPNNLDKENRKNRYDSYGKFNQEIIMLQEIEKVAQMKDPVKSWMSEIKINGEATDFEKNLTFRMAYIDHEIDLKQSNFTTVNISIKLIKSEDETFYDLETYFKSKEHLIEIVYLNPAREIIDTIIFNNCKYIGMSVSNVDYTEVEVCSMILKFTGERQFKIFDKK